MNRDTSRMSQTALDKERLACGCSVCVPDEPSEGGCGVLPSGLQLYVIASAQRRQGRLQWPAQKQRLTREIEADDIDRVLVVVRPLPRPGAVLGSGNYRSHDRRLVS